MGKSITNITKTGDDVTLSFMKGVLPTPKNVTVKDLEETGFTMSIPECLKKSSTNGTAYMHRESLNSAAASLKERNSHDGNISSS
jgi:hypothetical protein